MSQLSNTLHVIVSDEPETAPVIGAGYWWDFGMFILLLALIGTAILLGCNQWQIHLT